MTPKNFSALILNLYQEGHISFDDDMKLDFTPSAVIEIQECIRPTSIFDLNFDDTLAFTAIRKREEERRADNERRWAKRDAEQRSNDLKSIACSGWDSMHSVYGVKH